jgi:shikimate dehydrogenase
VKQIVMIGTPLTHVRSPSLLRDIIAAEGRDIAVHTHEIGPDALPDLAATLRHSGDVLGLIITTPLKHAICAYLDQRTADVDFIKAANCVRCDGGVWRGANFDGYGFATAIDRVIDRRSRPRVLLIGCGAAGSAIAASLVSIADLDLLLFDLDTVKAESFAARLRDFAPASTITAAAQPVEADIVINASTAGMAPDDRSPVPEFILERAKVIGDIVVDGNTALKRDARKLGKVLIDGEAMVKGQALYLYRFILGDARSEREVLAGSRQDEYRARRDAGVLKR